MAYQHKRSDAKKLRDQKVQERFAELSKKHQKDGYSDHYIRSIIAEEFFLTDWSIYCILIGRYENRNRPTGRQEKPAEGLRISK